MVAALLWQRQACRHEVFAILHVPPLTPVKATRLKVHELRNKSKTDLLAQVRLAAAGRVLLTPPQLKGLKTDLAQLRVAKVTGGAPNKLSKMWVLQGKFFTLSHFAQQGGPALHRAGVDRHSADAKEGFARGVRKQGARPTRLSCVAGPQGVCSHVQKYMPLDLRPKKTRAIRRRLSPAQASAQTEKAKKKALLFPKNRRYAVKA